MQPILVSSESIIADCAGDIPLGNNATGQYHGRKGTATAALQPDQDWQSIISGCAGDIPDNPEQLARQAAEKINYHKTEAQTI